MNLPTVSIPARFPPPPQKSSPFLGNCLKIQFFVIIVLGKRGKSRALENMRREREINKDFWPVYIPMEFSQMKLPEDLKISYTANDELRRPIPILQ